MPRERAEKNRPPWEYGSEFHWPNRDQFARLSSGALLSDLLGKLSFFGSGRDAIVSLLDAGRAGRGWERLWLPSYFCRDVTARIARSGLALRSYRDWPLVGTPGLPGGTLNSHDVVFRVNYFGSRNRSASVAPGDLGCDIIEDHTHSPAGDWALHSDATFCVASLRKSYPAPDGGVLWSPSNDEIPLSPPLSRSHCGHVFEKLQGMLLKQLFLARRKVRKEDFRELQILGESRMGATGISGISTLSRLIVDIVSPLSLGAFRSRNHLALRTLLGTAANGGSSGSEEDPPFSLLLFFADRKSRDHARAELTGRHIYAAILWELDRSAGEPERDCSSRMLSIPCDFRYERKDIEILARSLKNLGTTFSVGCQ